MRTARRHARPNAAFPTEARGLRSRLAREVEPRGHESGELVRNRAAAEVVASDTRRSYRPADCELPTSEAGSSQCELAGLRGGSAGMRDAFRARPVRLSAGVTLDEPPSPRGESRRSNGASTLCSNRGLSGCARRAALGLPSRTALYDNLDNHVVVSHYGPWRTGTPPAMRTDVPAVTPVGHRPTPGTRCGSTQRDAEGASKGRTTAARGSPNCSGWMTAANCSSVSTRRGPGRLT